MLFSRTNKYSKFGQLGIRIIYVQRKYIHISHYPPFGNVHKAKSYYWKFYFYMNSHVRLLVGWFVVGRSVKIIKKIS